MKQNELAKLVRRGWWATRGGLLFILPLPLILALFISLARGDLAKALADVAALSLFLGGATATKKGFTKQAAREEQDLSLSIHTLPYKNLGAVLVTVGTFITSYVGVDNELLFSILMALLSLLGFYFSYGFDPLPEKKKLDSSYGVTHDDLHRTLLDAAHKIDSIEAVSKSFANEELRQRLKRIIVLARQVLKNIEQTPRDLQRARKFLYVYLDGAKSVCEGYASTHGKANSTQLESNFRNVLVTIEEVFQQQQQRLLEKEVMDLDIQIEVLNKQLKREGIL